MLRLFCLVVVLYGCQAELNRRFEYKHSFKGPHLVQKDRTVPFWTYVGNAIASDDFVRLAPSLKSQRGLIWNKMPTDFDNWEVELTFKVAGRGRVGADGLAFWYTMEGEGLTGPVFGARDRWNGLGVFFDSFDNDGQNNNPYISAQVNDGTRNFDHQTDGSQHSLGGCMRDYRNKPYPVKAKIRYENKVLTLYIHQGLTSTYTDDTYELCLRAENVEIQRGGHFGVSAATGGLADDHDVLGFAAHSLRSDDEMRSKTVIADAEKEKLQKEYEEFDKQLNEAKDEYTKENPDAAHKEPDEQEFFDNDVRELRMIFEGQDHIHQSINAMNRRMNEVMGIAQQLSSQVTNLQNQGGAVQQGGAPAPPVQQGGNRIPDIQRHEVDHLIRSSNDLTQQINNLKSSLDNLSRERRDAPAAPAFADKSQHQLTDGMTEVKSILKQMQATQYANNQGGQGRATDCPSVDCVSMTYFALLIVVQIVTLALYSLYNSRKEAAAKKFY